MNDFLINLLVMCGVFAVGFFASDRIIRWLSAPSPRSHKSR